AGLFTKDHMAYDLDRDGSKEPSLAEMTGKAIDALAAKKKGFFLMVEGGRIDHALHATNARRALQDTVAFDNAIALALTKMEAIDPGLKNTLIVVTADHDHTLQMNGYAQRTGKTEPGKPGILGKVKHYVTGTDSTDTDGNPYTILGFGNGPNRLATRGPIDSSTVESKDYLQEAVVPLSTETHGGADVFLGAQGLGADRFAGSLDNTEVFGLIKQAIGL
ncbi:MAG: alkaline phosphatase, partial [Burkholderiaceae bacterium]